VEQELALTEAGETPCITCGQPLAGEALQKAVDSHKANIVALTDRARDLDSLATAEEEAADALLAEANLIDLFDPLPEAELEEKRQTLLLTRAAAAQLPVLEERRIAAAEIISRGTSDAFQAEVRLARTAREQALALLENAPELSDGAFKILQDACFSAETTRRHAAEALREAEIALATVEERLRSLGELAERSTEALAARAGFQGRLETLLALQKAYGRDGIPALILEATAIPQLEVEANRILAELGAPFRFELVTQRENKGGGLKDTLDVMVHGEKGTLRYESYSGGEQTRLAFALRVSLARLIASRRAAQAGVLVLDELPFLDGSGIARVCEVLRGLAEFHSILLVSHDDRFVDAFDQTVVVTRDENGSTIS
jgi:exonuclease SbcC